MSDIDDDKLTPGQATMSADILRALPKHGNGSDYTSEQRYNACLQWSLTGSPALVEHRTGIPAATVRKWAETDWWAVLLNQIARSWQAALDAKLTGALHRSLEETLDRLDNGDVLMTAKGETKRVPMRGRDAAVIAAMMYDKRALLRGQATSRTERVNLSELRGQFREVIEGNPSDIQKIESPNNK